MTGYLIDWYQNIFGAVKHKYICPRRYDEVGGVNVHASRTASWLQGRMRLGKWNPMHIYLDLKVSCIDVIVPINMYDLNTASTSAGDSDARHVVSLNTRETHPLTLALTQTLIGGMQSLCTLVT